MAIVINGSGTVTGLSVGGLPDGTVDAGTLATNSVDSAELVDGSIDSSHLASGVGGVAGISSSADATAITIDSSENVFIGTTSGYGKATIEHASGINNGLTLSSSSATANGNITGIQFSQGSTVTRPRAAIYAEAVESQSVAGHGADLCFATRGAPDGSTISTSDEKMRIDQNGYVRIGTSASPNSTNSGTLVSYNPSDDANRVSVGGVTSSKAIWRWYNGNGQVGHITLNGSATNYSTSSDYRLKENVDYTWNATTRLKQLKPARFNFIADDTNTLVDGFLAHEVSDIVPEAISGEKDAVDDDNNAVYQGIDQSKLVPLLVKTIQELEARITALEA